MGVAYYPKLVGMVPVTPLSGYRFLMEQFAEFVRRQAGAVR